MMLIFIFNTFFNIIASMDENLVARETYQFRQWPKAPNIRRHPKI